MWEVPSGSGLLRNMKEALPSLLDRPALLAASLSTVAAADSPTHARNRLGFYGRGGCSC